MSQGLHIPRCVVRTSLTIAVLGLLAPGADARDFPQASGAGARYKVVNACSLLSLAEVKKLAPWQPHLDPYAKGEEEALGSYGSACEYPTVRIQVMAFTRSTIDALRKAGPMESAAGVGDEAYVRSNRGYFAELVTRVGPHMLTVQLSIERDKTFEATKPSLIEIGKAFAARLR
jgi:hypothetical protein